MSDDGAEAMVVRRASSPPPAEGPLRVVPVFAAPPDAGLLVMLGESHSTPATAALRVIRHRLELLQEEGLRTFAVTSARDAEGKSTFSAQLGLVLSEAQRARVLLIEANLVKPSLARLFGFEVPAGEAFSAQIIRKMRGGEEPWTVLALGPSFHVLAESTTESGFPKTLHSAHFQKAVSALSASYDFVVVDAPSVLGSGDANVVENAVDSVIVVAQSRKSRGSELRAAVKQLGDRKALGVVLWDF